MGQMTQNIKIGSDCSPMTLKPRKKVEQQVENKIATQESSYHLPVGRKESYSTIDGRILGC